MNLDWLDEGALQLVLPDRLLDHWHGVDSSDYERACLVASDWLNRVSVGDSFGFLLGGDVAMCVCVPGEGGSVSIVRWICAENEHELVTFALAGEPTVRTECDVLFENADAAWRVFDAAADPRVPGCASRTLTLPIGRVRVQTGLVESARNAAIVHRFRSAM